MKRTGATNKKAVYFSLACASAFWAVDAALDAFVFKHIPFLDALAFHLTLEDWYTRVLGTAFILLLGSLFSLMSGRIAGERRGREEAMSMLRNGEERMNALNSELQRGCAAIQDGARRVAELSGRLAESETALRETEAKFSTTAEAAPFGVAILADGLPVYANRTALEICGITPALAGREPFWEYAHPQHRQAVKSYLEAGAGEQKPGERIEFILRGRDGKDRWVEGRRGQAAWNRQLALIFTFNDITEGKKANLALKESEVRYRRLVQSVTDYIYTVNVENGQVVSTRHGPGCVAVTGYTSEEYEKNQFLWVVMVHPEDKEAVLAQARVILSGETVQPLEHRIIHKNGGIRWVRNTTVPHYNGEGALVGYDGLITNITDRRVAEESLREHAKKLEILNQVIIAVNRSANLPALLDEVLSITLRVMDFDCGGIYLMDESGESARLACSRNLPPDFTEQQSAVRTDIPPYRAIFVERSPIFTDNYSRIDSKVAAKLDITALASVPLESEDRVVGAFNVASKKRHALTGEEQDTLIAIGRQLGTAIAKLKSETALKESEEKYRTITEQSLAGVYIMDESGLVFANEGLATIFGRPVKEIMTWDTARFLSAVHPEDRAASDEQIKRRLKARENTKQVGDMRIIGAGGEIKWILQYSRTITFAGRKAFVGLLIDITARKLAEQALASANRRLKNREEQLQKLNLDLTAAVQELQAGKEKLMEANIEKEVLMKEIHHRVKNNLQVISSLLKLQMNYLRDKKAVELLKECQSRIKSMALVHDKLCQAGKLAEIDVQDYFTDLAAGLLGMFGAAAGKVKLSIEAVGVTLSLDKAIPCSLIVNELISNSLKYAFPGGKGGEISVSLATDTAGKGYVLVVSDNGVGFPAETDFRNTQTIGMQLVMMFVEQLGGEIALDATAGAKFTITF